MKLVLESKQDTHAVEQDAAGSNLVAPTGARLMITPPITEDYWLWRVKVSAKQAVVAFPKFCTIGIGFQVEEDDWNTNLPYSCGAGEIYSHIKHNAKVAGDDKTPDRDTVIKAIKMLQEAVKNSKQ